MSDVLITPASSKIEFKDASNNIDGVIELDGSGNLALSAPNGDISLGDTAADVYIGDGSANVDIVFEQNGEIRGESGVTLSIGATNSNVSFAGPVYGSSNSALGPFSYSGDVTYVNETTNTNSDNTYTGSFSCTVTTFFSTWYIDLADLGSDDGYDLPGDAGNPNPIQYIKVTMTTSGGSSVTFDTMALVDRAADVRFQHPSGTDPTSTLNGQTVTSVRVISNPHYIYKVNNGTNNFANLVTSPPASSKFTIGGIGINTSHIDYNGDWGSAPSVTSDEMQFYVAKSGIGTNETPVVGDQFRINGSNEDSGLVSSDALSRIDRAVNFSVTNASRLLGRFDITSDDTYHSAQGGADAAYLRFLGHPGSGGGGLGSIQFADEDNSNNVHAVIEGKKHAAALSGNRFPGELKFWVGSDKSGEEYVLLRYMITDHGQHQFYSSSSTSMFLTDEVYGNSSTTFSLFMASNTDATVFKILKHGNVQNTNNSYGAISDIKLKENVIDASSQWDDIKAIQVRKYNYKPETGLCTHTQLGVIAQEVETISPGLVDEVQDSDREGNYLETTTKTVNYSVLYMKAIKALQEAMLRIESLEARVNELEGN